MANLEFHISTNVQQAIADLEAFLQQITKLQTALSRPLQIRISGLEDVARSLEKAARAVSESTTRAATTRQFRLFEETPRVETRGLGLSAEEVSRSFRDLIRAGRIPRYYELPPAEVPQQREELTFREQRRRYYEMREQILGTFMQLYALRNLGRFLEGAGTALDRFRQDLVNTGVAVGENMVRVAAVTGMTAGQMDRFASTVGRISAQAFLQPQQAMEVAYLVATRGIQDRGALETAIREIGQFAFMTRSDPAQTARALLTAFFTVNLGKPLDQLTSMMQSEFPRVANMLYSAYTRSPLEAQTILDALKYIGPAYGVTGRPFTELISTMMAAAQIIPQGGLLGRHLRSFLVFLSNPERIARAMQIIGKPVDVVGTISQSGLPQFLRQLGALLRNLTPEQQLQFWHTAVGLRAAPLAIVLTKMVDQIASYAQTLANESAGALERAIERIKSTPFGRLQTLNIEIQETKRQLSEAAMEAEIMLKEMQLGFLKMISSLPQGLQTSMYMLGKGAEIVGKGIGMFTDILSTALMWQLLRGLGKSPVSFLLKGAGIAGALTAGFTVITWELSETFKFLDNMRNMIRDASNYKFITPDMAQALEKESWGYRYLAGHKWYHNLLGPIDKIVQFFAMANINAKKQQLQETFNRIDDNVSEAVQNIYEDLLYYHGTETQNIINALPQGGETAKKVKERVRAFLKSAGIENLSDADVAKYIAGMAIDTDFLQKILGAMAEEYQKAGLDVPTNLQGALNHAKEFAQKISEYVDGLMKQIQKTQEKMSEIDKVATLAGGKIIDTSGFTRYLKFMSLFRVPPGPSVWGNLPSFAIPSVHIVYAQTQKPANNLLQASESLKDSAYQLWRISLGANPNIIAPPVVVYEY